MFYFPVCAFTDARGRQTQYIVCRYLKFLCHTYENITADLLVSPLTMQLNWEAETPIFSVYFYYTGWLQKCNFQSVNLSKCNSRKIPGISINSTNWPHIIKCMRYWLAVIFVTFPVAEFVEILIIVGTDKEGVLATVVKVVCAAGLLLSIYISAKKHWTGRFWNPV